MSTTQDTGQHAASRYQSQAVQTAPGPQLLVMLFDRLAADIEIAERALADNDLHATNERLQHAQQIVRVLRHSLQPDGFEGGQNLLGLYELLLTELLDANLTKDLSKIQRCGQIVAPLREAWRRAVAVPGTADVRAQLD
ncbi:MAG TPA: flagellar export chaperone FliS [Acidimicrobiales bacterium]|nr:flagellar export chaperone FliS [Acidimicrobiales bacterium]